jgi:hypothetical protein
MKRLRANGAFVFLLVFLFFLFAFRFVSGIDFAA